MLHLMHTRLRDADFVEGSDRASRWRSECGPARTPLPMLFTCDLSVELWEGILRLAYLDQYHSFTSGGFKHLVQVRLASTAAAANYWIRWPLHHLESPNRGCCHEQASCVSRRVAEAVTRLFSGEDSLKLYTDEDFPHHAALDSALLKSWAGRVENLALHYSCLTRPGLPAFLAAAGPLNRLSVYCDNVLMAAQIEHLFASCSEVKHLGVSGSHILHSFPPAVQSLSVCLSASRQQTFNCMLPTAFLYKLVDLRGLEKLVLHIADRKVLLDCPCLLPELKKLTLKLELHEDTPSSLTWVSRQPCSCLCLIVDVCTPVLAAHQAFTDQLLQLHIARLKLRMKVPLCPDGQTSWSRVRASSSCSLDFGTMDGHFGLLQALPSCPFISILGPIDSSASVSWGALTSQAARFSLQFDMRLTILGGWHIAYKAEGVPWQLFLSLVKSMALPDQKWGCKYKRKLLQNPAAIAAGWTADDRPILA